MMSTQLEELGETCRSVAPITVDLTLGITHDSKPVIDAYALSDDEDETADATRRAQCITDELGRWEIPLRGGTLGRYFLSVPVSGPARFQNVPNAYPRADSRSRPSPAPRGSGSPSAPLVVPPP
jgi:hypothetical protein